MKRFHIYFPPESREVFLYHLRQLGNRWFSNWTIYNDSEAFINACRADTDPEAAKISCFQIPFPYDTIIEKQVDEVYDHVDRVLVLGPELHQRTVDFIQRYDREKMTWFWYHFMPIDFASVRASQHSYCNNNSARISYDYIQNFRTNALGNFRSLIRNIATQPAMMYYLSNQDNTNTAPDENFAREVMELFTLGKDPLSQYTQDDVVAAAKVLTGWKVNNLNAYPTSASYINSRHDTTTKIFSSFFNNATIANQGSTEIDAFFDLIFTKTQVVSEYICRRLYRYFVYYDIDANIESNVNTP